MYNTICFAYDKALKNVFETLKMHCHKHEYPMTSVYLNGSLTSQHLDAIAAADYVVFLTERRDDLVRNVNQVAIGKGKKTVFLDDLVLLEGGLLKKINGLFTTNPSE